MNLTFDNAQFAIQAQLLRLGSQAFRAPPPIPTTCCGKGCAACVWEGYFAAVAFWLDDTERLLAQTIAQKTSL